MAFSMLNWVCECLRPTHRCGIHCQTIWDTWLLAQTPLGVCWKCYCLQHTNHACTTFGVLRLCNIYIYLLFTYSKPIKTLVKRYFTANVR